MVLEFFYLNMKNTNFGKLIFCELASQTGAPYGKPVIVCLKKVQIGSLQYSLHKRWLYGLAKGGCLKPYV